MNNQTKNYFAALQAQLKEGAACVSVTLVAERGHVPQDVGAKALVIEKGLMAGTVGGGKVEAKAIRHAQEMLETKAKRQELLTWNLQKDIGMSCGGEVTFFFELYTEAAWNVAVFGAGHVAQSLVRLLTNLDCRVFCIDTRSEWLDKLPESPRLTKILTADAASEVAKLPAQAFLAVMTQGHATDLPILTEIFRSRKAPYIGAIGSSTKASALRRDLAAAGISPGQIETLRCPMGLPIGDNSPEEIALSIAAQLLQERDR